MLARGATQGRALTDVLGDVLNIKGFGAKGDDASPDTKPFRDGLAAVGSNGGGALYLPTGVYIVDTALDLSLALRILANTTIYGDGPGRTVIKLRAYGISNNDFPRVFAVMGGNVAFRNLSIDGNKSAFNTSGVTTSGTVVVQKGIAGAIDKVSVENVWVHDVLGINSESFGFSWHLASGQTPTGALTNLSYVNCRGWNNGGTPFHVNGLIDDSSGGATWDSGANSFMTDGALVENCECYSNDWMGISVYGAKNVRVQNSRFYNNGRNGMNTEWSEDVLFWKNVSTGNTQRGMSVIGRTGLVVIKDNHLKGNNPSLNTSYAEICVFPGSWSSGSPAPRGVAGTVEIRNNRVEPAAGGFHFRTLRELNVTPVTIGEPIPDSILFEQADMDSWLVSTSGSTQRNNYGVVKHVGGPPALATVAALRPIDWAASAGLTVAAYTGTGNNSPHAVTISSATQNATASSKSVLLAGRTYRVRTRFKVEDADTEWVMTLSAGVNQLNYVSHLAASYSPVSQVNVWKSIDVVLTVDPTWSNAALQWARHSASGSSSSLDVDYTNVEELPATTGQSAAPQWVGRLVGRGTAAPTTGTWSQGDRWLNDNATPFGEWLCISAGTPGTWRLANRTYLHTTVTYDPPNIANAAQTTTTVLLTGAVMGDECNCSFSLDQQGLVFSAYVSSADHVTVVVSNLTGAALDLASGSLRITVWKN